MHAAVPLVALGYAAFGVGCAASVSRSKAFGVGLALLSMALPFAIPPEQTVVRVVFTLGTGLFLLRAIDLARDRHQLPLGDRLFLMFVMFDARERKTVARELRFGAVAAFGAYAALTAIGIWLAARVAPALSGWAGLAVRWLGGAAAMYGAADAFNALLVAVLAAVGVRAPVQHRAPVLSRSVREFWSERWNLNIQAWFRRHAFWPLARRGHRRLGIAAAFFVSAGLHFWLVAVPLGFLWALPMAAFFLLQGVAVLLETRFGVASWSRVAQHAWTVTLVLGTSPLFVEPALRVFAV